MTSFSGACPRRRRRRLRLLPCVDGGMPGDADEMTWLYAGKEDRVIVTKDPDFVRLQRAHAPPRGKVLWVRLGKRRKPVLIGAIVPALAEAVNVYRRNKWLVELR